MAYIGNDLQVAFPSYRIIDDISSGFNGSQKTFALNVGGATPVPFPINPQQCLISVNGVIQKPDPTGASGFNLVGSNIVFASAPTGGWSFFGVILAGADYVNVGANFPSGSAAAPSITFDSDTDTGIYNSGANQVSISTAGVERFRVDSAGQLEAVSLGSAASPTFSFTTDTNTGIYSPGADQVAISTNGAERLRVTTTGAGIGTTPNSSSIFQAKAATNSHVAIWDSSGTPMILGLKDDGSSQSLRIAGFPLTFTGNGGGGSEAVRIDSSGRLLVGTSSSVSNVYLGGNAHQQLVQVVTATNSYANGLTALNYSASGFAPVISLGLSKSNSLGSNTAVASGDDLGIINFVGNDGTNFRSGAFILAAADGGVSTGDLPTRLVFSTTADGASSPTERMRISADGLTRTYGDGDSIIAATAQAAGTTFGIFVGRYSATSTTTGTNSFLVYTNGNVVNTNNSYGAISDIKLKENIVDAGSQWDDLKSLQIRKYNFKEGQTHTQIGLIAQEVELVSPGLVSESPDRDTEGNDLGTVTKSVNYSVLYMKAVKALQEAMLRIEDLEARLDSANL